MENFNKIKDLIHSNNILNMSMGYNMILKQKETLTDEDCYKLVEMMVEDDQNTVWNDAEEPKKEKLIQIHQSVWDAIQDKAINHSKILVNDEEDK